MSTDTLQDNNPKTRAGSLKEPLRHIPSNVWLGDAAIHALGAQKYGPFNWRDETVSSSVYYESALRHLIAWYHGENVDAESGHSHLYHVRACMAILLDAEQHGTLNDDRPVSHAAPPKPYPGITDAELQEAIAHGPGPFVYRTTGR